MARAISNADLVFNAVVLEDELNEANLNFTVPEADITSFNDTYQNFLAGKPKAILGFSGFADLAASQGDATIFAALGGAALTWDYEPDGTTGYNGYGVITSYTLTTRVNEAIKYSASLSHNGGSAAADGLAPTRA